MNLTGDIMIYNKSIINSLLVICSLQSLHVALTFTASPFHKFHPNSNIKPCQKNAPTFTHSQQQERDELIIGYKYYSHENHHQYSPSLDCASPSMTEKKMNRREIFRFIQQAAIVTTVITEATLSSSANAIGENVDPKLLVEAEVEGTGRPIEMPPNFTNNGKSNNNSKPFASNEALLPAVRVKFTIDEAVQLTNELVKANKSNSNNNNLQMLETLLLKPQNYTQSFLLQGVPQRPAKQYLESYKPMNGDLPLQLYLIKSGDINTWKNLKRQEKLNEKESEIRAAFNAYTDVLSFSGNSYVLNVDSKTKSNMIRNDNLPELKQVITSDMGMRYLYRNQILTAMEDVKAEFQFQLSLFENSRTENDEGDDEGVDWKELLNLLMEAQSACDRWFSLIDHSDVEAAVSSVRSERK